MPIRITIIDDHTLTRQGLSCLMRHQQDIEVVAEAESAEEAASFLSSDVAILDLSLPGHDVVWGTRRLRQVSPHLGILVLSMHRDEYRIREALEAGANGYISKTACVAELLSAIRTVFEGSCYLHASVAPLVFGPPAARADALAPITPRELLVLNGVAAGLSNKEIAISLCLSVGTIKKHLQSLYRKFDLGDRTQLAIQAKQQGVI